MDWWSLEAGCLKEGVPTKETWVRVSRLPVHLWGMEFFKRVGNACEGSVAIDVEIVEKQHLH